MADALEKEHLIERMGSGDREVAHQAVDMLREHGWLSDGSLHEANLSGANLFEVNVGGANLRRANLGRADLTGADLSTAYLSRANLIGADLSRADLSRADLAGADLRRADLREANLSGADVSEAFCATTIFANLDLSTVKGLDTIRHSGPSTVGLDTLFTSGRALSERFLRGCGVPKEWVGYLRDIAGVAIEFYSCFISYSHTDKDFAQRLYERLYREGLNCWLDEHAILPGEKIMDEVREGVRLWDKVLLCCSEASLNSWWVENEIETAFEKERELRKLRGEPVLALIPLDLDGYLHSDAYQSGYKAEVRSRFAPDFSAWKDHDAFERQVEAVIRALRTEGGKPPPPESKL